jgi:hypothetical protein
MSFIFNKTTGRIYLLMVSLAVIFTSCQDDPIIPGSPDDEDLIIKTKVYISAIQINDYPGLDPNGALWDTIDTITDPFGQPDIFFNITDPAQGNSVIWSQQTHFQNVPTLQPTAYYLTQPFQVIPVGTSLDLNIYDYELPDSTLMNTISFFIGENPTSPKYPDAITQNVNGYSVSLGLIWQE